MGETITLTAEDGHQFSAYRADPAGKPKGGIVVMQEIFGVNPHIRRDTDKFAEHGYLAMAPAVFDRIEKGVELEYNEDGFTKGRALVGDLDWDGPVKDVAATAAALKEALGTGAKVGGVGYCWGGSLAWLAATRLGIPSVGYYGGRTAALIDEDPRAPVLLHFGEQDAHIPMSDVVKIKNAHPGVGIYTYAAGHGFNCDERPDFNEEAARVALERTLEFLRTNVG